MERCGCGGVGVSHVEPVAVSFFIHMAQSSSSCMRLNWATALMEQNHHQLHNPTNSEPPGILRCRLGWAQKLGCCREEWTSRSARSHSMGHVLTQRNKAETAAAVKCILAPSNPLCKALRKGASKQSNGFHALWNLEMMVKAEHDLLPWLVRDKPIVFEKTSCDLLFFFLPQCGAGGENRPRW